MQGKTETLMIVLNGLRKVNVREEIRASSSTIVEENLTSQCATIITRANSKNHLHVVIGTHQNAPTTNPKVVANDG